MSIIFQNPRRDCRGGDSDHGGLVQQNIKLTSFASRLTPMFYWKLELGTRVPVFLNIIEELILLVGHPGTGKNTLIARLREWGERFSYFCDGFRRPNSEGAKENCSDEEEESQAEIDDRNDLRNALLVEDVIDSRAVSHVILNYQAVMLASFGLVSAPFPAPAGLGAMSPSKIVLLTAHDDTIRRRMGDDSDFKVPSSEQLAGYLAMQRAVCSALSVASGAGRANFFL